MINKKIIFSPRGGYYYDNELYFSRAYQELTLSARNLLHHLFNELRWVRNSNPTKYTNNGYISFTERQFKQIYNSSSETYIRARNQLIKNGLIKQTHRGGYGKGDRSRYKVLVIRILPYDEQRWRNYPERNWEKEIPKMRVNQVGQATRFKKGQSGRKLKSTLLNRGLNRGYNPIKSKTMKLETP